MPNILILTELQVAIQARYRVLLLDEFPQLIVDLAGHHSKVGPFIADADVLLTFTPAMADHVARDATKLKWIQALGTGIDNIVDLPSLDRDVLVTNIRGIHGEPVSEAAFAAMLMLARDLPRAVRAQDRKAWERWPSQLLDGKTVGILGVGLIAEALAPRCKAFGMTVVGITAHPRAAPGFDRMAHRDDLVKVAADLDFLVLLTPPSAATLGIVGEKVLHAMKPSAFLVNVARGGIVDEAALIEALNSGRIAGAALDVFEKEPLPADDPLRDAKNIVLFAHTAGYSVGYETRAMPTIIHNMRCFLDGDPKSMVNIVRPPASWGVK